METLHSERRFGHRIEILPDLSPSSPDKNDDSALFLVGWHRDFTVTREMQLDGQKIIHPPLKQPEDIEQWEETHWYWNLYAYIHSGVALSLGRTGQFSDPWDSCQVGYVLGSKEEWPDDDDAIPAAQALVDEWNAYLSGNVVGFEIHKDGELVDSCWGFIGCQDFALDEARSEVDAIIQTQSPIPQDAAGALRLVGGC